MYTEGLMEKLIRFLRKLYAQFCIMQNNKGFHALEREKYRQLGGIRVDLKRVSCKLQTFWYLGSSSKFLFRCNVTKTLTQIDFTAV